jgi:hypothetical protein
MTMTASQLIVAFWTYQQNSFARYWVMVRTHSASTSSITKRS